MADELLLKYDIWTNLAHVKMLNHCGILKDDECRALCDALVALDSKVQQGAFHLDPRKEDVHINIEHHITHTLGIDAGKKIHTGRSRNDQCGTDIKLYLRDQLLEISENVRTLIEAILEKASTRAQVRHAGLHSLSTRHADHRGPLADQLEPGVIERPGTAGPGP